jgi:hypothetical protein
MDEEPWLVVVLKDENFSLWLQKKILGDKKVKSKTL